MRSFISIFAVLSVISCAEPPDQSAGKGEGETTGAERGACYGNGTCDEGFVCASDVCVQPGEGEGEGEGGTEIPPQAEWFCSDREYTVSDGRVETEHYSLSFALDPEEAVQMARMAEAAYAAMADYFKAEPTTLPLKAGWYADFDSFRAAIEADGTSAPEVGGYYWPGTSTAYMFSQPTVYYSRMLFLHELAHQFHLLARTGNQSRDSWYVEGLAEYLSRHDWDGECLRLGRLPTLSWEDAPAEALAEGTLSFSGSGELSRPWAWATWRYLQQEKPVAYGWDHVDRP